jgi:hypothetical protein
MDSQFSIPLGACDRVTGVTVSVVSLVPLVYADDDDDGTECNEKEFYLHPVSSGRCRVCDSSINGEWSSPHADASISLNSRCTGHAHARVACVHALSGLRVHVHVRVLAAVVSCNTHRTHPSLSFGPWTSICEPWPTVGSHH